MRNRPRRIGIGVLVGSLLGAMFVPGPPPAGAVLPPRLDEIRVEADDWTPGTSGGAVRGTSWTTTIEPSTEVDMVGVVVPPGSPTPDAVRVRTSDDGEKWGAWVEASFDADHGPDPATPEYSHQRAGTDPIYVGESAYVQLEAEIPPARVTLVGIDSDASSASVLDRAAAWFGALVRPAPADGYPGMVTRAGWGADEGLRQCGPSYSSVQMAFVHHTENSNTYSQAEAPGVVRGIYAYHVTGRGWCDIGYNLLIDRFGTVYEGRYGGVDQAVIGAQTGGFNSGSTGIAVIGSFVSSPVPSTVIDSLQRVIGWKLGVHGVYPVGQTTLVSAGNDKYPAGTPVTFRNVSGHRDGKYTTCPGDYLHVLLDAIAQGSLAHWVSEGLMPYGSFPGGSYVAVADSAGADSNLVSGADRGGGPHVRVQKRDGTAVADFHAYHPLFTGGVRVAAGDFDADARDEIVTAAGPGGGPHVRVFSLSAQGVLTEQAGLLAYDGFAGGVFPAVGDVDGDGYGDLVVGPDAGGGPHVRVFSLRGGLHEIAGFFAYTSAFTGGVRVGSADVDGDGWAEIITAPGKGGGPHVRVFSLRGGLHEVAGFYAYSALFVNGVFVAGGDSDGDGKDEIVTSPDSGGGSHVRIFDVSGPAATVDVEWMLLHPSVITGVRVAVGDLVAGGAEELALSLGPGVAARVLLRTASNAPLP